MIAAAGWLIAYMIALQSTAWRNGTVPGNRRLGTAAKQFHHTVPTPGPYNTMLTGNFLVLFHLIGNLIELVVKKYHKKLDIIILYIYIII